MKKTPASTPSKFKNFIRVNPRIGPKTILEKEFSKDSFKENTFNFVKAIPKDIRTRKIVA